MKSITRNNFIAVMVLVALGAPLSANASHEATVDIMATVTEKFSVAVDQPVVTFFDGQNKDVKITTTSNAATHGTGATLTIESDVDVNGKTMKLKHATSTVTATYPVDVKIGNADAVFDTNTKKTTHNVAENNSGNTQETILKLTSRKAAQDLPAGEYKGSLKIVVSPA